MYPLLVACKSISNLRKAAAEEVVNKVRQHSGVLVDQVKMKFVNLMSIMSSFFFILFVIFIFIFFSRQAQLVSQELIRVAILWHEVWHEALEEASRLYFGEHNIEGMLKVLEPLHEMLEEGAMTTNTTIKERAFIEVDSSIQVIFSSVIMAIINAYCASFSLFPGCFGIFLLIVIWDFLEFLRFFYLNVISGIST